MSLPYFYFYEAQDFDFFFLSCLFPGMQAKTVQEIIVTVQDMFLYLEKCVSWMVLNLLWSASTSSTWFYLSVTSELYQCLFSLQVKAQHADENEPGWFYS